MLMNWLKKAEWVWKNPSPPKSTKSKYVLGDGCWNGIIFPSPVTYHP